MQGVGGGVQNLGRLWQLLSWSSWVGLDPFPAALHCCLLPHSKRSSAPAVGPMKAMPLSSQSAENSVDSDRKP